MKIITVTEFIAKATVKVWTFIYNEKGNLTDPTGAASSIKVIIKDPDEVQKAGYISVTASASFTAGLVVTGGTSGATGYVISKPDSTTLELQRVTGVWQSGEAITDSGSGTSTTTSALLGADMTNYDIGGEYQTGIYFYYFRTTTSTTKGQYHGEVDVIDGSGQTVVCSTGTFGFRIK